jgi:type VI secretion system secreted protein VgrG
VAGAACRSPSRLIEGDDRTRVGRDSERRIEGHRQLLAKKDLDTVVVGKRRERDGRDVHLLTTADRRLRVGGKLSVLTMETQHERVARSHALEAGGDASFHTNETFTGESDDITIKGPGGFIRIDAAGVTIQGTLVEVNVGGGPGTGVTCEPQEPEEPEIEPTPPTPPRPDPAVVPPDLHQHFELDPEPAPPQPP